MPTSLELLSDPAHGLVREVRPAQLQMASSVEEVLTNGGVYFAEGPVGCGKSFAYLTPSLLAEGRRIVVATAKKQLQDQVVEKDLPAIIGAVGEEAMRPLLRHPDGGTFVAASAMKGKANYACRMLSRKHDPSGDYLSFLQKSRFGDRGDYQGTPPPWWNEATAEGCIGRGCDVSSSCGYLRLKGMVSLSRVVVVNHHLLGSDMYYGHGKMVGGPFDILIVDEAHKLSDGIRAAFTVKVSQSAIQDVFDAVDKTPFSLTAFGGEGNNLLATWQDMFAALPDRHYKEPHSRDIPVFPRGAEAAIRGLEHVDLGLAKTLGQYGVKGDPSDASFWDQIAAVNAGDDVKGGLATLGQARRKFGELARGVRTLQGKIKPLEGEEPEDYEVRKTRILENTVVSAFADRRGRFHINCSPVNLGGIAKNYFKGVKSVVLTSATLAVNDSFDHLEDVVGVKPTKAEVLPSAFDYKKHGFLYVPKDLPFRTRQAPDYQQSVDARVQRAVDLCRLSQGGAFILTTANDELDAFAMRMKHEFPGRAYAQSHAKRDWDGEPAAILAMYRQTPDAILIGSKSFWEGVDVVGGQLRLVIIAKLPFPIYGDPIVKARERLAGDKAFAKVQMVDMLTDLRQGAGRLIRSKDDRGIVAILDSRVWEKSYGRQVRSALQFPVTSNFADCEKQLPRMVEYFKRLEARGPDGDN